MCCCVRRSVPADAERGHRHRVFGEVPRRPSLPSHALRWGPPQASDNKILMGAVQQSLFCEQFLFFRLFNVRLSLVQNLNSGTCSAPHPNIIARADLDLSLSHMSDHDFRNVHILQWENQTYVYSLKCTSPIYLSTKVVHYVRARLVKKNLPIRINSTSINRKEEKMRTLARMYNQ